MARTQKVIPSSSACAQRCCGAPCYCDEDLLDEYDVLEGLIPFSDEWDIKPGGSTQDGPLFCKLLNSKDALVDDSLWVNNIIQRNDIYWSYPNSSQGLLNVWYDEWNFDKILSGEYSLICYGDGEHSCPFGDDCSFTGPAWALTLSMGLNWTGVGSKTINCYKIFNFNSCTENGLPPAGAIEWEEILTEEDGNQETLSELYNLDFVPSITLIANPIPP